MKSKEKNIKEKAKEKRESLDNKEVDRSDTKTKT